MKLKDIINNFEQFMDVDIDEEKFKELLPDNPYTVYDSIPSGTARTFFYYADDNRLTSVSTMVMTNPVCNRRDIGNLFISREEAIRYDKHRKIRQLLKRYGGKEVRDITLSNIDKVIECWTIGCGYCEKPREVKDIYGESTTIYDAIITLKPVNHKIGSNFYLYDLVYFDSEESCQKAIDSIGIKDIMKYMFGIGND